LYKEPFNEEFKELVGDVATLLKPRPRFALLLLRPLSVGRFASPRFRPKKIWHTIFFSSKANLKMFPKLLPNPRGASPFPKNPRSSGVEHLTLLLGKKSVALALIRHFGSLKGLARASFQELRQFLPRRQPESVVAALSMSVIAETEHAHSEQLDNPESIYRACADMKLFNQEVLRGILLYTRYRHISTLEITKGSINESLAHHRDIFRPVIGQSAFAFVLVHNLWVATHRLCYVKRGFMCSPRWSNVGCSLVEDGSGNSRTQGARSVGLRSDYGHILNHSFSRESRLQSGSPRLNAAHN
jgi:hypothetical protein